MAGSPGVGDPPCPDGRAGQADWSILVKKRTLPLSPQQAMSITDWSKMVHMSAPVVLGLYQVAVRQGK